MKGIKGNVILPFMIRLSDHEIDECSKLMCKDSTIKTHTITIDDPELIIYLSLKEITKFIPTRKSTVEESRSCIYINLTLNNSN